MDVGLQRLQPLLVRDAEPLLLVDDDEAEALELDALREDRVRADLDNMIATIRATNDKVDRTLRAVGIRK